jgi:glutathione S-transferase
MYALHGTAKTGTCAVQAALAEAGAPYEQIEVTTRKGDHLTADYRRINPRQQVPALRLPDGTIMTEGAAMLLHIGDAHPAKRLVPPPGSSARAQHDRWLIYFAVNVYEGELRKLFAARYTDDPHGAAAVQRAANEYVDRHYLIFERALSGAPYTFGDQFTVLDIYVWMLAQWLDGPWLLRECPRIAMLADAVKARPLIAPIHSANFG